MFLLNLMAEKRKKPERGRPCGFPGNAKRDGTAPAFIGISVFPQPCHGMNGLPPRRSLPHLPALFFPLTGAGNIPALRRNPPAACEPDAFSSAAKPSARRAPRFSVPVGKRRKAHATQDMQKRPGNSRRASEKYF